ncbi:hypothetical protein BJ912DRAFT_1043641 [Pholiota molesta]|nr:hypothetical protein BJ912DRAFT_1043641 [Pholiota molesta]
MHTRIINFLSRKTQTSSNIVPNDAIPLIIILGDSGLGKSTFVTVAGSASDIGDKAPIGHSLTECTTIPQEYIVRHPNKPEIFVRLIDTPGLDYTMENSHRGSEDITVDWLKTLPNARLTGILVLHCGRSTRYRDTMAVHLMHRDPVCVGVIPTSVKGRDYTQILGFYSGLFGSRVKLFETTLVSAWDILDGVCAGAPINRTTHQLAEEITKARATLEESIQKIRRGGA